jgi:hypothetical protein
MIKGGAVMCTAAEWAASLADCYGSAENALAELEDAGWFEYQEYRDSSQMKWRARVRECLESAVLVADLSAITGGA